ncbi:hypothetical protein BDF21DRAFT_425460 [Thamnidium elegans]|nr:hypothetical protein BDF21DRAFT_425460 [Thamnidium elegans]
MFYNRWFIDYYIFYFMCDFITLILNLAKIKYLIMYCSFLFKFQNLLLSFSPAFFNIVPTLLLPNNAGSSSYIDK